MFRKSLQVALCLIALNLSAVHTFPQIPSGASGPGSEAGANPACLPVGSHSVNHQMTPYDPTSDAGLRNMAKRHIPADGAMTTLTLADLEMLQQDISTAFSDATTTRTTFEPTRDALKHLATTGGHASEGDLVQLKAFVTIARAEGAESVNCGAVDGTDIHIAVGPQGGTEYQGIVAEMIPQLPRPAGWDPDTLNRLHAAQLPVLVVGGLTYDNEHLVNKDPHHPKSGQPKRMALWEIHPITEFYVCATAGATCDPAQHAQWTPLTQWARTGPATR
jgi:hypothetical protein